ncbi:MAG TPA: branched-chain amino acid ABC transporter permease [Stellaceae bacterium]
MDLTVATLLLQDGIANGAIYALLALAAVMVFAVTRIIFIPQGEFVSFAALSMAALEIGIVPPTVWLVVGLGLACAAVDIAVAARKGNWRPVPRSIAVNLLWPGIAAGLICWLAPRRPAVIVDMALVFILLVPLGPMIYRLAFQPFRQASILVLLMVSVAVHYSLAGLGFYFFGAEGSQIQPYIDATFDVGSVRVSGQDLLVVGAVTVLSIALYLYFEWTIAGKALRATAINRVGARLVGIGTAHSGRLVFGVAAAIGILSGILVAPITAIYYDTGFLLGIKGFVGAIFGGMLSYPLAAAGAILIGILDSFFSFWSSQFKDAIVFTLIIPVLFWRSFRAAGQHEQDDG